MSQTELYIGTCEADLDGKVDFELFKGSLKSRKEVIYKGEMIRDGKSEWVLIFTKSDIEPVYTGIINKLPVESN